MKRTCTIFLLLIVLLALSPAAFAESEPDFAIARRTLLPGMSRSYLQGYEPDISNAWLSLLMPVESDKAVGSIKAELTAVDEASAPFRALHYSASTWRVKEGIWALSFSFGLHTDRENGDYPCTVHITGQDGEGRELSADIPYTLRIRDGRPNSEPSRVQISHIQADLKVGEDAVLTATVKNPCRTMSLESLTLKFSDPGGDILPGDSDLLVLPDLLPGQETELSIPVTVLNKTAVEPHSLLFRFQWTALGEEMAQEESFTFPVGQEIRLEQGGLRMAESVVAGDTVTATLPLMNLGKADVVNAMVTVSLPGFVERQSVLVGTIAPGETKQAQITLSTGRDSQGSYSGELTVEGSDQDGNSVSFSLPLGLTVEEPVELSIPLEQTNASSKVNTAVILLSAVCAVLAALLVLQSVLLRRKIYRLEEERL